MREIKVYGADWCGDCIRAKRMLDRTGTDYEYIDVELDAEAKEEAIRLSGRRRIPVIVFPNGDILVEPNDPELEQALLRLSA